MFDASGRGALDEAACTLDDGPVDHPAVQLHRAQAGAAGRFGCLQHALRPEKFVVGGCQRTVDGRDLLGVYAQLGAEAVAACAGQVGEQGRFVVQRRADTGHGCCDACGARDQGQVRVPVVQRQRLGAQVEIERVVDGAEDQALHPRCRSQDVRGEHAACTFDQRQHGDLRAGCTQQGDGLGALGLGQHHGHRASGGEHRDIGRKAVFR